MAQTGIDVYELPSLGMRVYYTPPTDQKTERADAFSYYSHKHPYYELHLMLEGTLQLQAADRLYTLRQGDFCLICPGVVHAPKSDVSQMLRCCVSFDLTASTEPAAFLRRLSQQKGVHLGNGKQLLLTLEQLRQESESGGPFSCQMTAQLLSRLLLQMLRHMALPDAAPREQTGNLNDLRTVRIDHFLNNCFHLQGAQQRLAQELGISRRQLDRVFKTIYGKGFQRKLLEVRAAAACDLLRGDTPIGQIALRVGYSTSANFTAFFKNAMGMTPGAYRESQKY